ncbi:Lsr2 family protein [Nakamurella flavida]|uniref:Lsr2 family protein n=1 Tax=Nakamurella flavida TaxID=363630 RepID=A0A939C248_9ACTN|nr:Lsr2 family protein [Nakamurella flavida]MBM9475681.1 Lsr2 family protein [Nakamurella flavida]MDP9778042.1 hypothetical protein [Nakamurella flavida]
MAQQTSITLVDDLDGGKAVETISFSLDGSTYEIDLNKKNANALRKALSDFVEHGRKVRGDQPQRRNGRRTAGSDGPSPVAVREWATAQGISVSPRGRIASDVVRRYQESQA